MSQHRRVPAVRHRAAVPSRAGESPATSPRPRGAAREALLDAALAEFTDAGFERTDTNRIARRAGYAPQTFYRHFRDKTDVFVEAYRRWIAAEWQDLERASGRGAEEAARILLAHHATHREFRRSLRRLAVTDEAVRAARAESRRRQLELLEAQDRARDRRRPRGATLALLLSVERIADAAADGELDDLGLSSAEQVTLLADVIRRFARDDGPNDS